MTAVSAKSASRFSKPTLSLAVWLAVGASRVYAEDVSTTPAPAVVVSHDGSSAAPATDPPGYSEAIDAGLSEYDRGHYEEARAHFLAAHTLLPNARTLRALGNTDFELRNYGDAARNLQASLNASLRPLDDGLRTATEKLLARAKAYVGEVHVQVDPESAMVVVDGVSVARGPKASLALLVGKHVIEFRASGRLSERRTVDVVSGDRLTLEVVLPSPLMGASPATMSVVQIDAHDDTERPMYKRPWLWVGVGVAAAALGTGLALGLRGRHAGDDTASGGSSGVVLMSR